MIDPTTGGHRPAREIVVDLARFTRKASRLIDIEPVAASDLRANPGRIERLLDHVLALIVEATRSRAGETPNSRALVALTVEAANLDDEWRRSRQRDGERAREDLAASLVRLARLRTEQDIADRVCAGVCRGCGSDRALFARISGQDWLPVATFTVGSRTTRPRPATAAPLLGLPVEWAAVEHRRTVRVGGPGDGPRPAAVDQLMRRRSFLVAPVVAEDRVVGLLYAAETAAWSPPEQKLTRRLERYAAGVGGHLELVRVLRRLDAQSAALRRGLAALQHSVTEADTEVDLLQLVGREQSGAAADDTDTGTSSPGSVTTGFTAREREVMLLLSAGLDNSRIGERLAIAESTVKSHIQHMLRKAGAVNRAELIGRSYAASPPDAAP